MATFIWSLVRADPSCFSRILTSRELLLVFPIGFSAFPSWQRKYRVALGYLSMLWWLWPQAVFSSGKSRTLPASWTTGTSWWLGWYSGNLLFWTNPKICKHNRIALLKFSQIDVMFISSSSPITSLRSHVPNLCAPGSLPSVGAATSLSRFPSSSHRFLLLQP